MLNVNDHLAFCLQHESLASPDPTLFRTYTMWPSQGQWHFSVCLVIPEGQKGFGDISPSAVVPLLWWSLVVWQWRVTWMWTVWTPQQIEELQLCFYGENCCATSEDRLAGKQRQKLEQKVIQTHVFTCSHDCHYVSTCIFYIFLFLKAIIVHTWSHLIDSTSMSHYVCVCMRVCVFPFVKDFLCVFMLGSLLYFFWPHLGICV